MKTICQSFPITTEEYDCLTKCFGRLCYYAAHQLQKKNSKNNYTDDFDDINQELQLSIIRAGSYYKRQIYIEKCLSSVKEHNFDGFTGKVIHKLVDLWTNRTRHGANRQKFGAKQELMLDAIVRSVVPRRKRPNRRAPLKIDSKFSTYCKAIVWNGQKSMGKKITREKSIRSGQVSLSEYDYLNGE
jgi:hypothetical protein